MTSSKNLATTDGTDEEERYRYDGDQLDLADRHSLRRVAGLSTELEDVTEVEYRQLRLERVVLVGVWTSGTAADAEASLHELAALARPRARRSWTR
jgi:GTP-binding protein HflX